MDTKKTDDEIKKQDKEWLEAFIKGYVNKYNIRELEIHIEQLYKGKTITLTER